MKESYKKNIDYTVSKVENNIKNKYVVIISMNCFKKICMRSRFIKGEEDREYFIELEMLLNKYMNDIFLQLKQNENNKLLCWKSIEKKHTYIIKTCDEYDNVYKLDGTKCKQHGLIKYAEIYNVYIELLKTIVFILINYFLTLLLLKCLYQTDISP